MALRPKPTGNTSGDLLKRKAYLTPGEKFGDYQVMQCITFGVLGGLYRMQHIREFEEHCLFVFPKDLGADPGATKRFNEQVAKLGKIKHPNLLGIESHSIVNGHHCFRTELVEGVNMNDYLETFVREKQAESGFGAPVKIAAGEGAGGAPARTDLPFGLPAPVVKDLLTQTAGALKYAHLLEVEHFALNPANMILTTDGVIKIVGLGLVELVGLGTFKKLAEAGLPPVRMGTRMVDVNQPEFLAPEIGVALPEPEPEDEEEDLSDLGIPPPAPEEDDEDPGGEDEEADDDAAEPDVKGHLADFYALGYCGYFYLTGHRPLKDDAYLPPSSFSASIPEGWDKLMSLCLRPDPEQRHKDSDKLLKDLSQVDRHLTKTTAGSEGALARQLERIPLPETVRSRFPAKVLKTIRLAILGSFAIFAVALSTWSYQTILKEEGGDTGPKIRRAKPGAVPQLTIAVQPPFARVKILGRANANIAVTNGKLNLSVPIVPDPYTIRVEAPDHLGKVIKNVTVSPDKTVPIDISLDPAFVTFQVSTEPGTHVFARREQKGDLATEETKLGTVAANRYLRLVDTVLAGTYDFRLAHPNYLDVALPGVELKHGTPSVHEVSLPPRPGKVRIVTDPPGATVTVAGATAGVTPMTLEGLEAGAEFPVGVTLAEHRPKEATLVVDPGEDGVLNFGQLIGKTGLILPRVTLGGAAPGPAALAAIKVIVGSRAYPLKNEVGPIPIGSRTVKIEHPDYLPHVDEVRIEDGARIELVANLAPRMGRLILNLTPKIDLSKIKVQAGNTLYQLRDGVFEFKPGAEHTVKVIAKGFMVPSKPFTFGPNESQTWDLALTPIPGPEFTKPWQIPYVGTKMTWIEPGAFDIGSPNIEQARLPDEGPPTRVTISKGLWAGIYEVTQSEFRTVMGASPSATRGKPSNPVERVNWNTAMEFCRQVTAREREEDRLPPGYIYRLPTEAEWEYFARAGNASPFHFGPVADSTFGNFKGAYPRSHKSPGASKVLGTAEVGSYTPNAWGLYDIHGNVREWVFDRFNSRYPSGAVTDYAGHPTGSDRTCRGGGYEDFARDCRVAKRDRVDPNTASPSLGLRLVLAQELPDPGKP